MRYLLVGNAANCADIVAGAAEAADIVVQHNTCDYAELLPPVRANYVFITNSGGHGPKIANRLLALRDSPAFAKTRLMLARNPVFYTLKKYVLRARKHEFWPYYEIQWRWTDLSRVWPVEAMSFQATARLESRLRKLGMESWRMPSTGMVAGCAVASGRRIA